MLDSLYPTLGSVKPTKLQAAAHYIVSRLGSVTRTKLVKLIYLSDYFFYNEFGRQLTEADYRRQERGPLPVRFDKSIEELRGHELEIAEKPMFDGRMLLHRPGNRPRFKPELEPTEGRVVDYVLSSYGYLPGKLVTEIAYKTRPMVRLLSLEARQGGKKLLGQKIRFQKFIPKLMMRSYQDRLKNLSQKSPSKEESRQLWDRDLKVYKFTERYASQAFSQLFSA